MRCFCLVCVLILFAVALSANDGSNIETDSLQTATPVVLKEGNRVNFNYIIPAVFISYGALAQVVNPLQQFDSYIDNKVSRHFNRRRFDDYIQYAPLVAAYSIDMMGIKSKHNFRDKTFVVVASHIIMGGSVQAVKMATGVERPDGGSLHSFPSGHTAMAFTGAHILFKEYRERSPWIGIAGYATATTVGTMRVLNRRHWVSDVVAGAGIGILSAEIGYLLLPVFHRIIGAEETKSGFVVAPTIGNNQYGLGLVYMF